MKNCKRKEKSLYALLIKNYIIFTLVLFVLILGAYLLETKAGEMISKGARLNEPIGEQALLKAGEYEKLNLKKLLGAEGYFEILDENGTQLYTDYKGRSESYTKSELSLIPEYNTVTRFQKKVYVGEDGEEQTLVTESSLEEETGYRVEIGYMILDQDLKVIGGNLPMEQKQMTERELAFLAGGSVNGFHVYKYTFADNKKEERTLLMHVREMDGKRYRKLTVLFRAFIPVYVMIYAACTLVFTILICRKVKKPLIMLNEGILDFAEGKRDTEISYKGPKEFEDIFRSFNKMAKRLTESESSKERLIVEKQRMLADISHDLKTPITVIQGYAKAVLDGLADKETQKQYLKTIFAKTESLTEMINTFHDFSKLEHPEFKLVREKQDLAEFVREYLADKYDEIVLQGFTLEAEIPEEVMEYSFDGVQLKRVFDNIFSNALKHNKPGTVVYLTLQQTDKTIRMEIGDNGAGIPEEIWENLFEPFTVGDDSRNTKQGSGLGLAVAKKIVELHGGALFLEKAENPAISTLFVIRFIK